MKRWFIAAAAVAGFAANDARADWGTTPIPPAGYGPPPAPAPSTAGQYGWNPIFKKVLWWKKDGGCPGGCGHAGYGPVGPGYGQPQGTLVFPTHPFNRSPRDFFMHGQTGNN